MGSSSEIERGVGPFPPPRTRRATAPSLSSRISSRSPRAPGGDRILTTASSGHTGRPGWREPMHTQLIRLIAILAAVLLAGLPAAARAEDTDQKITDKKSPDTSKVGEATKRVESGAKQAGEGIKETAKGIGNTVVEGAKVAGEKVKHAAKEVEPQAKSAWQKTKDGAADAAESVKNFFKRLFSG